MSSLRVVVLPSASLTFSSRRIWTTSLARLFSLREMPELMPPFRLISFASSLLRCVTGIKSVLLLSGYYLSLFRLVNQKPRPYRERGHPKTTKICKIKRFGYFFA